MQYLCIAILWHHLQNVVRKYKWKNFYFRWYFVIFGSIFCTEGICLSYITFYSTFNTRNRGNIKHYLNTLFWLANSHQSPSKFQEKYDGVLFHQSPSKFFDGLWSKFSLTVYTIKVCVKNFDQVFLYKKNVIV